MAVLVVVAFLFVRFRSVRPAYVPPEVGTARARDAIPVPDLRFTDVTAAAGIRFRHVTGAAGQKLLPETMGSGVAVIDFDGDGRPDLVFVNSRSWPGHEAAEPPPTLALYRNKGDGTFEDVTAACGLAVSIYGLGVCVGDYDNDGWPDLFVTAIGGNRLFHNESGGPHGRRFVDATVRAGVGGPDSWPTQSRDAFLRHQEPIAFPSSATFVDYDGDGWLDLFVCHYVTWSPAIDRAIDARLTGIGRAYVPPTTFEGAHCALYRNRGDGSFEDVSAAAGVRVAEPEGVGPTARPRPVGKALGVVVCDPDGDGWPDLVVANDTVRNFFFHNVPGPDGTRRFEEVGLASGVAYAEGKARGGMGIDWGEYRPGHSAFVIANFANEPNTFLALDDVRRLLFSDAALAVGLAGPSRGPLKFGAFFFDADLDGWLDLLTCNGHLEPEIAQVQAGQTFAQPAQLFWNTGRSQRLFEPVTAQEAGPDLFVPLVGRGSAYLDFDGDGDLDLVLTANGGPARLLRNDKAAQHHWVRLTLEGDGRRSNRSAIGAEVTVEAGGQVYRRQVAGARGYLSQSELTVTVGLGATDRIDRVTVRWPGRAAGLPEEFAGLTVDRVYVLRQGAGQVR
jgi:hypothetical protein